MIGAGAVWASLKGGAGDRGRGWGRKSPVVSPEISGGRRGRCAGARGEEEGDDRRARLVSGRERVCGPCASARAERGGLGRRGEEGAREQARLGRAG